VRSAAELIEEGRLLRKAGDWARAEQTWREATSLDPDSTEAWAELGCLLADGRRFSEAVPCFRRAVGQTDAEAPAAAPQETVQLLGQIASVQPDWSTGQFSLGSALEHLRKFEQARMHLANALRLDPSREAAVQALLARTYSLEGRPLDAIAAADRSLQANPDYFLAHAVRSRCCAELGRIAESVESRRKAIEICPHRPFHSMLLFDLNYLPETTPEALYAEACRWNSLYAAPVASRIQPHTNAADPDRALRVGYVSSDLHNHAMMRYILPVLERQDREQFELYAYSTSSKNDEWTGHIRASVTGFQSMRDPQELATRVRQDGIDILVDLSGHTMGDSLLAFAEKPAPVQVSWIGVPATSGMPAIDYFLGDAYMPCPGTEHLFAEKVYRLPRAACCYRPFRTDLPVAPAPCLERGYVTFGCFNSPYKINREVVKLWSAILHLSPPARLLLKYFGMENPAVQDRFRQWFQEDGIAVERVMFKGKSPAETYLADYGAIDIALDPFPYNGGSTTLDALWMGVPVVSLAGRLTAQRAGASILSNAGLSDLVAQNPEQYMKAALFLAAVVPNLPEFRRDIRKALLASPWMDEAGVVRDVEDAYRQMWRAWCRTRTA
jgi:protein O-GlcNAc transferase